MRFISPVSQPIVRGWSSTHFGIDYLTNTGTPVKASGSGKVVFAGTDVAGGTFGAIAGKVVAIDHGDVWTEYAHLSLIKVKIGQLVTQGDIIALSGATGNVTGPHLHFGFLGDPINWNNGTLGRLNPNLYLNKGEDMLTNNQLVHLYRIYYGRAPLDKEKQDFIGKVTFDVMADKLRGSDAYKARVAKAKAGTLVAKNHLPNEIRAVYVTPAPVQYEEVTERLYRIK
jgi:hypothetical protein